MSDKWWEKRRKKRDPWFNVFREFDKIEEMMDEMMHRAFRSINPIKKRKPFRPHVYGFSISMDHDGKPKITRFSNVRKGRHNPRIREQREPLVDVLDEGKDMMVVAELPGVEKEDINLQASEERLTISVHTPQRKYHKELPLPEEVNPKQVKTSYKNGVLEVRFKKR